jgi:hypothetical protein
VDTVQSRAGARRALLELEQRPQVGRIGQLLVVLARRGREAVLPGAHLVGKGGVFGAQAPVDLETGGHDREVDLEAAARGADAQAVAAVLHRLHRAAEVERGVRVARHTQRAAMRRRHLGLVDVVAQAPALRVGQQVVAVRQARHAGALALVDARQVVAADQQIDTAGTALQRRGGAVHGR